MDKEWLSVSFKPDYSSLGFYEDMYFPNCIEFPIKIDATADEAVDATNVGIAWVREHKFPRTSKRQWKRGRISFHMVVTRKNPNAGAAVVAALGAIFNEFPECRVNLDIHQIPWKDWAHVKQIVENMSKNIESMELGMVDIPDDAHRELSEVFDIPYAFEDGECDFKWPKKQISINMSPA